MFKKTYKIPAQDKLAQMLNANPVSDDVIGLENHQYKALFGDAFKEHGSKPHLRGIVRIRLANVDGAPRIYRKFHGIHDLKGDLVLVSWRTLHELISIPRMKIRDDELSIEVRPVSTRYGRFLYYYNHPDDAARFSFKLGTLGVVLGVYSMIVGWKDAINLLQDIYTAIASVWF